ncbi:Uma2 family endonuclease [Streptomyces sp. NPDC002867]
MTDLRVEILAGSLVLSRADCATRTAAVRHLAAGIAPGAAVLEGVSLRMPRDQDDFVSPDLVVPAPGSDPPMDGMVRTQDVEVVPREEKTREFGRKSDWYAVAGVRALLVVDPRHGTWALHTSPSNGSYQDTLPGTYGEEIPLPDPLALSVATGELPLYGDGDNARPR